jgi:hypothetical protein
MSLRRGHAHHVAPRNAQPALAGVLQASNDVEQGGLAAPRGADQNQKLARCHIDVGALEHLSGVVALAVGFLNACNV